MNLICMIVDDHEKLRTVMCDWLQGVFPEVNFIHVGSGEEALSVAFQLNPHVILLDIGLPGISGIEVTRRIKNRLPNTCIIIHTIHEDKAYFHDASAAGADGYITKNKTQTELIPALQKQFASMVSPD